MSKQASPAVIGGFMIGALALTIIGIMIFGSGKFFADIVQAVMYFEGDLKGLRIGASVDFQGVQVGTVSDIKAMVDPKDIQAHIPVIVEISRDKMEWVGERPAKGTMFRQLIERGMRAQLQLESMVTGQLFIQLTFHPEAPAVEPRIDPLTKLPEIPTVPTTMQQVQQTIREALEKIGQLPLKEIVTELHDTLRGIDQLVNAPEIKEAIQNLNLTLTETRTLVRNMDTRLGALTGEATTTLGDISQLTKNIDGHVPGMMASFTDTLSTTRNALQHAQDTLKAANEVVAPNSPVRYELVRTLQELGGAARSLRILADYLERYPNAVVFGRNEAQAR